jgi:hypothetical protein
VVQSQNSQFGTTIDALEYLGSKESGADERGLTADLLITNYAVLNTPFFPKHQHFQKLIHDRPYGWTLLAVRALLDIGVTMWARVSAIFSTLP